METTPCNLQSCSVTPMVCGWSRWASWESCSQTCGGGQQQHLRQKTWVPADTTGAAVDGAGAGAGAEAAAAAAAATQAEASKTGSTGSVILGGRRLSSPNTAECVGSQKGIRPCGLAPCVAVAAPVPCRWASWSDWGSCSCEGLRERDRSVAEQAKHGGLACVGPTRGTLRCDPGCTAKSVDCGFGPWSDWSECTTSCGGGQKYHTRGVVKHAEHYGSGCEGSLDEVVSCNTQSCAKPKECGYGVWSDWSACSHSCDGGARERTRSVEQAPTNGGALCARSNLTELGPCGTEPCKPFTKADCSPGACEKTDCRFGNWSAWSSCSDRCGGHQERIRGVKIFARGGGSPCQGSSRHVRPCERPADSNCSLGKGDIDCLLGAWSDWSDCSADCGGGQRTASRHVRRQARGAGAPCNASLRLVQPCNTQMCPGSEPVDCAWGDWGSFSECSVSCGGGEMRRHRSITAEAKRGGRPCSEGDTLEMAPCNTQPCGGAEYCAWSHWTTWQACSATCGGGQKKRHRMLDKTLMPPPSHSQPTGLELAMAQGSVDADAQAAGLLGSLVLRYQLPLCALAAVGALSMVVALGRAARRLQPPRAPGSAQAQYMPLGTEDPATLGAEDVERPAAAGSPDR